jgi:hypothetical protein
MPCRRWPGLLNDLPTGVTLSALRWAFFAGEPLTGFAGAALAPIVPAAVLVNLYGDRDDAGEMLLRYARRTIVWRAASRAALA